MNVEEKESKDVFDFIVKKYSGLPFQFLSLTLSYFESFDFHYPKTILCLSKTIKKSKKYATLVVI
jgi:hypothetical protein